jgi:twitching motility protein PilT
MSDAIPESAAIPDDLRAWLLYAVESGASDLHLIPGHPPVVRVHGELTALPDPPLDPRETQSLLRSLCPADAFARLVARTDLDFSFELPAAGGRSVRFRANLFRVGGHLAGCLRVIPSAIPDFGWANFPPELAEKLAFLRDGLVILSGATGSGKSTTLAMVVNLLNRTGGYRIITVEEPVEYLFPKEPNSVVTQREVGRDVPTFADGLKYGLRQDPDVILVGEIRDRETAQMALSAAETGHLVFTTLHTRDAKGAVSRFADLFPQDAQRDVRGQLAMSLRAVVSQRLLPGATRGAKRQLALEVLWNTHPVASAIRSGKVESIDNCIVTGREDGMVTFDESVRRLLAAGKITRSVAEQNVSDASLLNR